VGEIIQPGKWGRETLAFAARGRRGIQNDSDAINLIWEAALEAARLVRFPDAISRLDCVFACFWEEDARAFRDHLERIIKSIELNSSILRHRLQLGITAQLPTPSQDPTWRWLAK
jgi:hypothetical protein